MGALSRIGSVLAGAVLTLALGASGAWARVEYFRDDFSAARPEERFFFTGSLSGSTYEYRADGQYVIDTTNSDEPGHSVLMHELSAYELEARGQLAGSSTPRDIGGQLTRMGWGLSFNYRESAGGEQYLLFLIHPAERTFVLDRVRPGGRETVIGPEHSDAILHDSNVLRVRVSDGDITVLINEQKVGEYFEPYLLAGGFGLYVTPRTSAAFDYFVVYTEEKPQQVVSDDFSGTPQRWFAGYQDGVNYRYREGRYEMDATGSEKTGVSLFPGRYESFTISVSAHRLEGETNRGFGLFFQDIPNQSGGFDQYRFLISDDGWFTVQRSFEDTPRAIYNWAPSGRIQQGVTNRLKVRLSGGKLTFFINDFVVYELTGVGVVPGKLGLYVASGLKVSFDDFYLEAY
ncbi:MAG: hypothetical protein B1H03_01255 [Planctomycetales bacterium 4484_113]|nr:MAG: hypothetical protein B1H03_01255 [Planctomycetales bacterium 4484_113]